MKKFGAIMLVLIIGNSLYSQTIEQEFQAVLDSIYQSHPTSVGIMVHVESPDHDISWSGAVGYSDQQLKTKIAADQPALIASSIKTYVSVAILRLVEDQQLTLEMPISPLLSEQTRNLLIADGYDLFAIKVKHLLSHTSGIFNYADQAYIDDKNQNPKYRWTRDKQLALAARKGDPLGKAGISFHYADTNYLLLTEIIENLTGQVFYKAMRHLLRYEELGLNQTWFPTLEEKPLHSKELVHQYWGEYDWDSYELDVSWDLYGGGGIACPTRDLAKFIYHFFNGDIVKDPTVRDLIFTEIKTKETEQHPYYLGLSQDSYHDIKGYGHGGFWATIMLHFPEINTSIAVYILDRDKRILRRNVLDAISKVVLKKAND